MKTLKIYLIILCLLPVLAVGMPQFDGVNFFMKEIKGQSLTYGSFTILVDDEDFDHLSQFKWSLHKFVTNEYVHCRECGFMHRYLLKLNDNQFGDHKDGNGLNNQKDNLRIATRQQNSRNRRLSKNNKTGFKGVSIMKDGRFMSCIYVDNKPTVLGKFKDSKDAAIAYNEAAIKLFGEFAFLNDLTEQTEKASIEKIKINQETIIELDNGEFAIKQISLLYGEHLIYLEKPDFDRFKDIDWSITKFFRGEKLCASNDGKLMHSLIMMPKKGQLVEHIDGNGLNNRRSNLRLISYKTASINSKLHNTNTTGFRGVTKRKSKFEANITIDNKIKYLGVYETAELASNAYKEAVRKYFPESLKPIPA